MRPPRSKKSFRRVRVLSLVLLAMLAALGMLSYWTTDSREWRIEDHYKVRELQVPRVGSGWWESLRDDQILIFEKGGAERFSFVNVASGKREALRALNEQLANHPEFEVGNFVSTRNGIGIYLEDEQNNCRRLFGGLDNGDLTECSVSSAFSARRMPGLMWPVPEGDGWFEFNGSVSSNGLVRVSAQSLDKVDSWSLPGSGWFVGAVDRQTIVTLSERYAATDSTILQIWRLETNGVAQLKNKSIKLNLSGNLDYAFLSPGGEKVLWVTTKSWRRPALIDSVPFVEVRKITTRRLYVSDLEGRNITQVASWPSDWGSTARWMPSGKAIRFEFNNRWYVIDAP